MNNIVLLGCIIFLIFFNFYLYRGKKKKIVLIIVFNICFITVIYRLYNTLPSTYVIYTPNHKIDVRFSSKYKEDISKVSSMLTNHSTLNLYVENYDVTQEEYIEELTKSLKTGGIDFLEMDGDCLLFSKKNLDVYIKYKVLFVDNKAIRLYIIARGKSVLSSKYADDFYNVKIETLVPKK